MAANKTKFLSMLGLARKAGKIIIGSPLICESLAKRTKPSLVIIASDASEQSVKKLTLKSQFYNVEYICCEATKAELAHAVGKESELAALAVTENGFSSQLLKLSGKEASDNSGSAE